MADKKTKKTATTKSTTKKPTSASSWNSAAKNREPVELPSGNYAYLRVPGAQGFLKMGFIPNSLMGIVKSAIAEVDKKPGNKVDPTEELSAILEDEDALNEMLELYDKVTVFCMEDPRVAPMPAENEEREEDVLYVDMIDFDDKVFIFQHGMGGTKDLESFRRQQAEGMESLQAGEGLADEAE